MAMRKLSDFHALMQGLPPGKSLHPAEIAWKLGCTVVVVNRAISSNDDLLIYAKQGMICLSDRSTHIRPDWFDQLTPAEQERVPLVSTKVLAARAPGTAVASPTLRGQSIKDAISIMASATMFSGRSAKHLKPVAETAQEDAQVLAESVAATQKKLDLTEKELDAQKRLAEKSAKLLEKSTKFGSRMTRIIEALADEEEEGEETAS